MACLIHTTILGHRTSLCTASWRRAARVFRREKNRMPFAEFGDARLHYRWDGPENAPVVLLSNSLGTDLTMWDAQAAAWSKTFRVLRYDTPGPYSMQRLGCDVAALMDAAGVSRAHFCGLSMGGQTGLWLASNAPERLE